MSEIEQLLLNHGFWIKKIDTSEDGRMKYRLWFRNEIEIDLLGYTYRDVDGIYDYLEFVCHHKRKGFPKYENIREFLGKELVKEIEELENDK